MKYTIEDIDDYQSRLTDEQKKVLIKHCNKFQIFPDICAWYDDMDDFYTDWVYDHSLCANEEEADERYQWGLQNGEFKQFSNGEIVRLTV